MSADYFDNVMTKVIVNNRIDTLKTVINLFFTITNFHFPILIHKLEIHVSVHLLTINISQ